jgi:hypothetical protein
MLPPHPPRQPLNLFDKSKSPPWTCGAVQPAHSARAYVSGLQVHYRGMPRKKTRTGTVPYEVRFGRSLPTGRDRPQVHVWLRAPRKKTQAGVRCRPTAHSARAYVSGRQSTFCAVTKKTTAARATFSSEVPLPKSRERYSSDLWCRATKKNSRSVTAEALPKLPGSASAEQFGPSLRKGLRDGPQVRYRETPGKRRACTFSVRVPLPKNRERYSSDLTVRRHQKSLGRRGPVRSQKAGSALAVQKSEHRGTPSEKPAVWT